MVSKKLTTNRRDFLKTAGMATCGLLIGLDVKANTCMQKINGIQSDVLGLAGVSAPHAGTEMSPFIIITNDNKITLVNPRNCMGQGTIQSVPALIAEELEVDLEEVTIIQSDGKAKYGSQTSGGSSSIRTLWIPLRRAGAAARCMLIEAAAKRWGVPVKQCYASKARVYDGAANRSLSYGELIAEAAVLPMPAEPPLKPKHEFRILGKQQKRPDIRQRVTGQAVYGIDVDIPGLLYASILHSPMIFGKLVSFDASAAMKVPGVIRVVKCERKMIHRDADSVAVVATNWWAANNGRNALRAVWDNEGLEQSLNNSAYISRCYTAAQTEGIRYEETNDFKSKFTDAKAKLEVIYETPFLSHVPLEPENTTAHVRADGTVDIWAPIQGPGETLPDVAAYLGLSTDKIKIHVTLMGGSFGRKAYIDFVKEACFLSRAMNAPVKVLWTREDDIRQGPYRPALLSHMQGFTNGGKITGYHHHVIGESILRQVFKGLDDDKPDPWVGGESSVQNNKYQFRDSSRVSWTTVKTEIPVMWWRSVNASNLGWGQECFMDELAYLAGSDPLKARLDILEDRRFIRVLTTLAEKSGYETKLPAGSGRGIAVMKSFDSICACCFEVSKKGNGVKIDRVVSVIDCGMYVNLDTVKAQTEGNIVMGITAAIKPGIVFSRGECGQHSYNDYPILRMMEMPRVDVFVMENDEAPGGVGEPGLPPVAPALGNAIFAATGIRIRKLPFDINQIQAAGVKSEELK